MNNREDQQFIKIANLDNTIEAQVIADILTAENIPHRLRSFHDTAYDGLFQFQQGWGELYGPASRKQEIIDIFNEVRKTTKEEPS